MRVTWEPAVSDRLAGYYVHLTLDEQRAFADSVQRVADTLAVIPRDVGESRGGSTRVWIVRPVTYWYTVDGSDVRVVQVHVPDSRGNAGA